MIKDRAGNILSQDSGQSGALDFLYGNALGRIILKLLTRRFISELGRKYMESPLSKRRIAKTVSQSGIDMSEYEDREYTSFNDFFTRKIKAGRRPIDTENASVISPADSKLTVYDISGDSLYRIKGCDYSIKALLGDESEAESFYGGKCFVFRLSVDNYHRYCYTDDGEEDYFRRINGVYHTVNPIALEKYDVYGKNCREITYINTEHFGRVAYIEVGAMMVGRINNRHASGRHTRGEEKGYFSFGGSTIIMLYPPNSVVPDGDIAENSKTEAETTVRYGERVGRRE